MNPNLPPPPFDPNSSSLAYLNHLPPGTQAHYRTDLAVNQPQLRNRPAPGRVPLNPGQDLVDAGEDISSRLQDGLPDNESNRGLERARSDASEAEILEHSEPVHKQRRNSSPEPVQEVPVTAQRSLSNKPKNLAFIKAMARACSSLLAIDIRSDNPLVKMMVNASFSLQPVARLSNNPFTLAAIFGELDVLKYLAEHGDDIRQKDQYGMNALMYAVRNRHVGLVKYLVDIGCNYPDHHEVNKFLFNAIKNRDLELLDLLIPLHDVSNRDLDGLTPLMRAAAENVLEAAVPLIQATLKLPNALKLIEEALAIATGPFFRELLKNPFIVSDEGPKLNSALEVDSEPFIFSAFVSRHVLSQYDELQHLRASLGSGESITPMQIKSAKVSVLAELTAWKLQHPDDSIFKEHLPSSLLLVRERAIAFINKDIESLTAQALQWEENHVIPVVANLYECCLNHSLSEPSTVDIINELTSKGLYHSIAQKVAKAWTSAWAAMSPEAAPMIQTAFAAQFDGGPRENRPNPELLTQEVIINADTVTSSIDHFAGTPVGIALLEVFRAALRREFDAVGGEILRTQHANLSTQSKALYADLMGRQLHLIAQFWRAES